MFFLRLAFSASQYIIIWLESQSVSLDESGKPLSNVKVLKASPNFLQLQWLFITTYKARLSPIAGSKCFKILARAIVSLYYLCSTNYINDFNSIIFRYSPGFELGSPGPKAATLPLCYTPFTSTIYFVNDNDIV